MLNPVHVIAPTGPACDSDRRWFERTDAFLETASHALAVQPNDAQLAQIVDMVWSLRADSVRVSAGTIGLPASRVAQ